MTNPTKKPMPWFPFNVKAYVTDTMRLTTEAHGAYLLLMLDYYSTAEAPPDDDDILAAIAKLSPEAWVKHRKAIQPYFKIIGGRWVHERIELEMVDACQRHATASAKGKAGAEAKQAKRAGQNTRTQSPAAPQVQPQPSPSQKPSPSRTRATAPAKAAASPQPKLNTTQEQEHSLSIEREGLAPSKAVDEVGEVQAPVMITDTQIAPDYRPGAKLIETAMADCGDMAVIEHELVMFVAYMQERGAFSASWDASWTKWWGRWKDRQKAAVAKAPPRISVNKQPEPADYEQAVMRWKSNNSHWSTKYFGPEPGMTGCKCPPDILTRNGIDPATGRKLERA